MSQPQGAPGNLPPYPAPPFRRTVVWLDRAAVTACALALSVVLFGGIRFAVGSVRLSAMTPWTLGAAAVAMAVIRHSINPYKRPWTRTPHPAAGRVAGMGAVDRKVITSIWVTCRIGVLLLGFAAVATLGFPPNARLPSVSDNPLVNLPYRWDSGWYLAIAVDGYHWDALAGSTQQQSVAFFPAYPLLMRAGGAVLGARAPSGTRTRATLERLRTRTLIAGWLLALAASYAALDSLFRWASAVADRRTAFGAVALLSTYPFAIYFSTAYTESLFLLCVLATFNGMRTGRTGMTGAWGLMAGLLRPNGFLVTVPLAMLAWQQRPSNWRPWAAAAMPCVGMLIFAGYLWSLTGHPFAWVEAHAAWGRTRPTWAGSVSQPLEDMARQGMIGYAMSAPYQVVNGAALLLCVSVLPIVWRRLGAPSTLLVLVMLGPPLLAGGLMSMGRVTSTVFPIFVALAQVIPRRHLTVWLVAFALAQGLVAAIFFTWRPMV